MPAKRQNLKKVTQPKYLVVVAHPDDETLFFSGVLFKHASQTQVICITDGNADSLGKARQRQFKKACRDFGVFRFQQWDFPDLFDRRLDIKKLEERLDELQHFKKVFTHGPLGEYGHPHHQDVCLAVHRSFHKKCPVYSISYNTFPQITFKLSQKQYLKKLKILTQIYYHEVRRFLNFIPVTFVEGFSLVRLTEVEAIYDCFTQKKLNPRKLKSYAGMKKILAKHEYALKQRPF